MWKSLSGQADRQADVWRRFLVQNFEKYVAGCSLVLIWQTYVS